MYLNFSDIPGQNNLFLDYLYEFENVSEFYNGLNYRDPETYYRVFKSQCEKTRPHRKKLAEILSEQYKDSNPAGITLKNIQLLSSQNTVAVVTGQQLGLFGGPLYTFYKIITAIKLCSHLRNIYTDYSFVPVFWMEGDDHDFREVAGVNILDQANEIEKLIYDDNQPSEVNRGSVGRITFGPGINEVIEKLNNLLRDTDFKSKLVGLLGTFYKEGRTFKQSFRDLLFHFFDEFGLIIFDPQDKQIKEILRDIFKKEINNFRNHTDELVKRSARLEELYHAQVKVNPVNLFYNDDDGRYLIEPVDDQFRLKGKRKRFSREELLELIDASPERFSSNVLLRPICQDYIFPTAFYVGGPAEISYFAQLIPLYGFYDIPQPIIYPRSSATILEKGLINVMDKYSLGLKDLFMDKKTLHEKVLRDISGDGTEILFNKAVDAVNDSMERLQERLNEIDKTLNDSAVKTREKIQQGLEILRNKTMAAEKKKHESTIRQLDKLSNILYPLQNLQEREFSFIYYAHKYGLDIIKQINNELTINKFEHQIIEL
ncbi:MAG: bacillithiol biosynthesis cysteine-adding enzyme BshC [Bacteroidota bacterium]